MRGRRGDPLSFTASPIRVFLLVLLVVFSFEGAIMLVLPSLPVGWHGTLLESVVDAGALTIGVAPAVWVLLVLPLRRLSEDRGELLRRTFESQEQERARVARELHDGLGQQLTTLLVGLRGIQEAGTVEKAGARAREMREVAAQAHGEVRRLARGLRPLALEELGFASAVERLCADFQRTHGIEVALHCDAASVRRLAHDAEAALYRIAQEALSNVARHAGASRIDVTVTQDGTSTRLVLRDDGRGLPNEGMDGVLDRASGFGLGSIRERARMLGGEAAVYSSPGHGTTVDVLVPMDA